MLQDSEKLGAATTLVTLNTCLEVERCLNSVLEDLLLRLTNDRLVLVFDRVANLIDRLLSYSLLLYETIQLRNLLLKASTCRLATLRQLDRFISLATRLGLLLINLRTLPVGLRHVRQLGMVLVLLLFHEALLSLIQVKLFILA